MSPRTPTAIIRERADGLKRMHAERRERSRVNIAAVSDVAQAVRMIIDAAASLAGEDVRTLIHEAIELGDEQSRRQLGAGLGQLQSFDIFWADITDAQVIESNEPLPQPLPHATQGTPS